MINIPHIYKKINDQYLVWIQDVNLYFQLEEPAWFVFERLCNGLPTEGLPHELSEKYGYPLDECKTFIVEMYEKVKKIADNQLAHKQEILPHNRFRDIHFRPYSSYKYRLGEHIIRFNYEHEWLEEYIHPLITHLIAESSVDTAHNLELLFFDSKVVFRYNNVVKGAWNSEESHLTKGMIFLELINILHGKSNEDWLMTVHASAITNGKKTILFSAASGSGKTTMAALLQNEGYHLISDDFVPFDINTTNAYPFPIAMSVKEGSLELLKSFYPDLEKKAINYIDPTKKVRYWPIDNEMMQMVLPANNLVFIQYNEKVDFEFEEMDLMEALTLLLDQIWVPPSTAHVEALFDRITAFSFYKLTYSDNAKAINAIKQLFGDA